MPTIGIIQPSYLPWRGFFDFIKEVDVFVHLDDVQYTVRDWRNRNRIKLPGGGSTWLTVPVLGGRHQLIKDVRIDYGQPWRRKHLAAIEHSYGKSSYFSELFERLAAVYAQEHERLVDLDIALIATLCEYLGLETPTLRASELGASGSKDDRLLAIVQVLEGDRYLSGPSAQTYLRPELWAEAGVELAFKDYSGYPPYAQVSEPFEPAMSVIDLIFMQGHEATDYIWGELRERVAA